MSKGIAMRDGYEATGTRRKLTVIIGMLVVLLVTSAVPGHAQRGGHGGGPGGPGFGPGGPGFGPGGPGFGPGGPGGPGFGHRGPGFIGPRFGVSIEPYWDPYWTPYWAPYDAPPVVVAPSPQIYVQPAPPTWYYCEQPPGYYPYVPQCPGGWRQVAPTPH